MRRLVALCTAFALVLLAGSTALGETETGSYRDKFLEPGYSGNDGNLTWETDWREHGEDDGYSNGMVQSVEDPLCPEGSSCLYISGNGLLSSVGAHRRADTSILHDVDLSYKIRRVNQNLLKLDSPELHVQVTSDGDTWETLRSYVLDDTDDDYLYESVDVDDWSSPEFGVRFRVTGLLPDVEEIGAYIDYVEVKGTITQSSTTTSSTTSSTSSTTSSTSSTTSSTTTSSTTTSSTTTTTTTEPESTTTTRPALTPPPELRPPDSGIREAATGLQADFGTNAYGNVTDDAPDVLGVEFEADYTMAVEIIESSWVWMLALVLLIATAIVSGMDRRRVGLGDIQS